MVAFVLVMCLNDVWFWSFLPNHVPTACGFSHSVALLVERCMIWVVLGMRFGTLRIFLRVLTMALITAASFNSSGEMRAGAVHGFGLF